MIRNDAAFDCSYNYCSSRFVNCNKAADVDVVVKASARGAYSRFGIMSCE